MGFALRKEESASHHRPLSRELRALFAHYEASYYDFVTSLTKAEPVTDELLADLLKFRVFRNAFYSGLLKESGDGLVTYLDEGERYFRMTDDARLGLLDAFPRHADRLVMDVPIAYLPFIKMSEDPFSEILGQTLKLNDKKNFITVKSGTGKELPTAMHEHLHAAVRGLPGVFEEGFCRHSLQSRGIEPDEMPVLAAHEREMIRANFSGIYYPNLLVNILAQAVGPKQVEDIFFSRDTSELDAFLRRVSGRGLAEMDRAFRQSLPEPAIDIVRTLGEAFGKALSNEMKKVIEVVCAARAA